MKNNDKKDIDKGRERERVTDRRIGRDTDR